MLQTMLQLHLSDQYYCLLRYIRHFTMGQLLQLWKLDEFKEVIDVMNYIL